MNDWEIKCKKNCKISDISGFINACYKRDKNNNYSVLLEVEKGKLVDLKKEVEKGSLAEYKNKIKKKI